MPTWTNGEEFMNGAPMTVKKISNGFDSEIFAIVSLNTSFVFIDLSRLFFSFSYRFLQF